MTEETPPDLDLAGEWDAELESRTVKDRVYEVATTLASLAAVAAIADRADCTKEGARPYLEWFVKLGVLEKVTDNPAHFPRTKPTLNFGA